MRSILLVLWAVLIAGCPVPKSDECSEDKPCGIGSVCQDNVCVEQSCATSDQCGIGQYCGADRTCTEGCEEDSDCRYGDLCDATNKACVASECTDTRLDCSFNEFCSPAGECYDAGGYYCAPCSDDGDCGGAGNICYDSSCAVECDADDDCPAGYDCLDFVDLGGNVVGHYCYTYCWLYEE